MKTCKNCNQPIPNGRLKILPGATTCVTCSTEEKWSAIHVIHHKTGNEVQIVKDAEVAKEFNRLASRAGFGTLRGMKPGKKVKTTVAAAAPKFLVEDRPSDLETLGTRAMEIMDIKGYESAITFVKEQIRDRSVSDIQGNKVLRILNELKVSTKEVPELTTKERYNPYGKYEPKFTKEIVSKEIMDSFKNWRK